MIYLDNSSTTKIDPEVLEAMLPYLQDEYGNPSSSHYTLAKNAKRAVEEAREKLASLINAKSEEIIFTAGASESNNFVIKGVSDYKKMYEKSGNHIITSKVEHKSVLQVCRFLNGEIYMNNEKKRLGKIITPQVDRGYEVDFLDVNEYGQVTLDTLESTIKDNTSLISLIWGNNEIGSLNDIATLSKLAKQRNITFHSDATQVLGKLTIDVDKISADYLSFSAHKLYGPKGVGAVYMRKPKRTPVDITSLIHGGYQENFYRAGTHAVHNIVGFGKAAEIAKRDLAKNIEKLEKLELQAKEMIKAKYPNVEFLGDPNNHIPGLIGMIIPGIVNEMFIKERCEDLAISAGSACGIGEPSYVINEIGYGNVSSSFVRLSLCKHNNMNDIHILLK
ncbi:cysteine desulfurase family protein [Oceanirhabdus seepicola]|uniref:Cysteine desulfurase n=1 Tax=Oceanirhabdus seepicola TaxID=2828781 RepID=A0A9J6NWF1_9CLOT|nr:cysteine desulfurase family protein [Oceanirhabdus seepicola]MCM1988823.1 cysteine desulfurase [Oceanirhabdus seepicola]